MAELDLNDTLLSIEAAHFLKISPQKLSRLRLAGKIAGKRVGNSNLFAYKLSDLRSVDPEILKPQKTGPKPKNIGA